MRKTATRRLRTLAVKATTRLTVRLRVLLRSHEFYLLLPALVIGMFVGALVTAMALVAQIAHVVIFQIPFDVHLSAHDKVNPWIALAAPTLGGLILGIMEWWRRRLRISNAVDPIEANALRGGNLSLRDSLVVSGQTLISNGCGASVGLEAGYTQIGAGIASLLGRFLHLRRNDLRLMVGCGAAAAIAGAFGAPITGAFYACELIIGVYAVSNAAPILAASIAGALTARALGGAPYSLELPLLNTVQLEQYLFLIGLALIACCIGIAVMRSSSHFEKAFSWLPVWLRPATGGVIVGALAIITPQILGAGHGAMVLDLKQQMTLGSVAIIILLKLTACLVSLASGFRGGLFFASLFVGSLIGKLFAAGITSLLPNAPIDPMVAMLTGMATLGVAIVGGPLTMSFLVLEMTRNVDVTAVVLAGCIVTSISVRFLFGHSFSTWRLHLRGETIRSANDVGWLRSLTVERMMRSDVSKISADATIAEARSEFALGSCQGVVIVDSRDAYVGIVMMPDLYASELDTAAQSMPVVELARFEKNVLSPKMNIKAAMSMFDRAEAEMLAVVATEEHRRVIGFLTESFARRRYANEMDQVTRGVVGSLG